MQAVWMSLQFEYPWLVVLPCTSNALNLLLADCLNHALLAKGLSF